MQKGNQHFETVDNDKTNTKSKTEERPHLACLKNSLPSILGVRAEKEKLRSLDYIYENRILELS